MPHDARSATPGPRVASLLAWSDGALRDLPWRRTRDPWLILLSELMSQQTQVSRVVDRWPALSGRFPDAAACAAAGAGAVIAAWSGLGYNRRAVNLHRAAVRIVDDHGGRVPDRYDDLVALPGVGPYTARAVLVFAYEQRWGVLDTNVGRVLARAWAGRPLGRAEAQGWADTLAPASDPWRWNQALLDLGATVCRARSPRCDRCPVRPACRWRVAGGPDPAVGSAAVSTPQARFEGSDRQGRGRLVAALRDGPVAEADVAATAGWPDDHDRARRVADRLVDEGLASRRGGALHLPDDRPDGCTGPRRGGARFPRSV